MNNKHYIAGTVIAACILIFAGIFAAHTQIWHEQAGPATSEAIKIGQMSGLTGDGSDIGAEERNGTLLAAEEINAAGGIGATNGVPGRPIDLISEDTPPFDLKKGASAAEKLISIDGVSAIVGPQWDSQGELMASVSAARKVPVVSQNVSTDIEAKASSPYFFVTWPDDEMGIKEVLRYAQSRNWSKIAIVEPANFSFWSFTANLLVKDAPQYGIQIVANEMGTDFGNTDYRTLIAKTKAAKPDAFFGSYTDLECVFLKQTKGQGMDIPLLSTDSAGTPKVLTECPYLLAGHLYFSTLNRGNGYDNFVAAYTKRFGAAPTASSAVTAYNAMHVLVDVMNKLAASGREITRDNIRAGLAAETLDGAVSIGTIRFNDKGYMITPADAYEMQTVAGGKFVEAK